MHVLVSMFLVAIATVANSKVVYDHSDPAWAKFYRLDTETFKQTVLTDTVNVWVVAFVSETCGSCTELAVVWERLTTVQTITARKVKFGYININEESCQEVMQRYTGGIKIIYTPTVLLYGKDKSHPVEYEGDYKFASLHEDICDFCDQEHGPVSVNALRSIGQAAVNGQLPRYNGYSQPANSYSQPVSSYSKPGYGYSKPATSYNSPYGSSSGYSGGFGDDCGCGSGKGGYGNGPYGSTYGGYGHSNSNYGSDNYGRGSSYGGYGYSQPKVVATYGATSTNRIVNNDYNRSVRQVSPYGSYPAPAYNSYRSAPSQPYSGYKAPSYNSYQAPSYNSGYKNHY